MNKLYKDDLLTIYTPTYNRAYCLTQLYESLVRQKRTNFQWLIIDDGSNDNTADLVLDWKSKSTFKIDYYKQMNEGKMAKLNFAHSIIDSELCVCIDSDDYLTDTAVDDILKEWETVKNFSDIGGMVGLDIFKDGSLVGTGFPSNTDRIKYRDFDKLNVKGDKKFVYKTSVLNKYPPYPSFSGEKFPAPGYLYRLIDVDYSLWIVNKPLCIVEYMDDGLSKNKYSQFRKSPNSFMYYRHERMRLSSSFAEKFRNAIHYVSSCLFANKGFFRNNDFKITTFFAVPIGILLNMYIKKTKKKGVV